MIPHQKLTPEDTNPETTENRIIFNKNNEPLCSLHSKPIEAFCHEDSSLVCITCILSNEHKGHTLHSIEKAIDLQIAHIGTQFEKATELKTTISKQKKEVNEKLNSIVESCTSKRKDIEHFFKIIKEIINGKEEKLLKEIDEKLEITHLQFGKKLNTLEVQGESIEKIQEMLNIKIEESIESKISFLDG